jgi:hypothetical protein
MLPLVGLRARHHRVINNSMHPVLALMIKRRRITGLPSLCQMPLPNLQPSMLWIWAGAQLAEADVMTEVPSFSTRQQWMQCCTPLLGEITRPNKHTGGIPGLTLAPHFDERQGAYVAPQSITLDTDAQHSRHKGQSSVAVLGNWVKHTGAVRLQGDIYYVPLCGS